MPVILRVMGMFIKVDDKVILFCGFRGQGYACNPKAIFEEMRDNVKYEGYTFIFALKDASTLIPGAEVVRLRSAKFFYYSLQAKYWVFNSKMASYMYKRKSQVYFQTWHGVPLKRLAHDIQNENQTFYFTEISYKKMVKSYDADSKKWDLLLVSSEYMKDRYESAFNYPKSKMFTALYPRNKVLLNYKDESITELKQRFNIPENKKVILYAPTYRDDSYDTEGYQIQLEVDFDKWYSKLGDEYVVLFKPHYLIDNTVNIPGHLQSFVQMIDAGEDINDCYLVSDVLITDYSSVFFDYALLNRPIYFYMYDFCKYKDVLRGFYLDVTTDLPNEVIQDEEYLLDQIKQNKFSFSRLKEFNNIYNPNMESVGVEDVIDEFLQYR